MGYKFIHKYWECSALPNPHGSANERLHFTVYPLITRWISSVCLLQSATERNVSKSQIKCKTRAPSFLFSLSLCFPSGARLLEAKAADVRDGTYGASIRESTEMALNLPDWPAVYCQEEQLISSSLKGTYLFSFLVCSIVCVRSCMFSIGGMVRATALPEILPFPLNICMCSVGTRTSLTQANSCVFICDSGGAGYKDIIACRLWGS